MTFIHIYKALLLGLPSLSFLSFFCVYFVVLQDLSFLYKALLFPFGT